MSLRSVARKLGVKISFLEKQPIWIQEDRGPTQEEFTTWSREQHERACQHYLAAYPVNFYQGKCSNFITFNRPCCSFFSNTGQCDNGVFEPTRITVTPWVEFQKNFKKEARRGKRKVELILRGRK